VQSQPPPIREPYIYFGLGEWTVDSLGKDVVSDVASQVRRSKDLRQVLVVAHADRAGGAAANHHLSELRARAVADALIGAGVPRELIVVEGRGETEPAVPTADGVAEPVNRRAIIELSWRR